jgi:hypothetical protein
MRNMLMAMTLMWATGVMAAPPATKPATLPATKPAPKQLLSLMNGSVKFLLPAGWIEASKAEDGKSGQYNSPDGLTTISFVVIPQEYPVPLKNDNLKEQMKTFVIKGLTAEFQKHDQEILYGPRSETDDRFYLRIHARIKDGDETLDQIHLYRAMGLDLLMYTAVVKTDQKDQAAAGHAVAVDMALSTVFGPADKKPGK